MSKLRKLLNFLNPKPLIGGLEISESAVRYVLIGGKSEPLFSSIELVPGIIENGRVKDKEALEFALLKLHSRIASKPKKKIYVVISVPENEIYAQLFNLPFAAEVNLDEAAKLNLQMISPIEFNEAYSDWQKIEGSEAGSGQIQLLGAFIQKAAIDDFAAVFRKTHFVIVAVEFPALALSRLIKDHFSSTGQSVALRVSAVGLSFSFVKNGDLCFNHFAVWPSSQNRQIVFDEFKKFVAAETRKVLNYVGNRFPGSIDDFLLISPPSLEEKISKIVSDDFSLNVKKLSLSRPGKEFSADWFVAFGSALRGLISRSKDALISLIPPGTEAEYRQHQLLNVIGIWRNIVFSFLGGLLAIFIIFDFVLVGAIDALIKNQLAGFINLPPSRQQELRQLEEEAAKFNSRIALALEAQGRKSYFSSFFEKLNNLAGSDIFIDRVFIQNGGGSILISGRANDEEKIIAFKKALENELGVKDIDLPLAGIVPIEGKLGFTMTFGMVK